MPASPRVPAAILLALLVGFILLRAALFAVTTASEYPLYREYATTVRESSLAELNRGRVIEYPALAILLGVAVAYVADALPEGTERMTEWRPEATRGPAPARYEVALGLVLLAVDVACLALLYHVVRRVYPHEAAPRRLARIGLYVAATTILGLILYDRQDLVVGLIAITAIAAFIHERPLAAYAVLSLGVAYKLVPVLLIPLWVMAFAAVQCAPASPRRFFHAAVRESAIAAAVLSIPLILMYALGGGPRAFEFLSFHSLRGLQLEASPAWAVLLLDADTTVGHSYGSFTLRGSLADQVAKASSLATVVMVLLALVIAARGFLTAAAAPPTPSRHEIVIHLAAGSLLVWLGFILCSKVGSPQYMLWLAPLLPLLPLRGADRFWTALLLVGMVLTTLIYPCLYIEHVRGAPTEQPLTWTGPSTLGLALLAAKTVVHAAAFAWLALLVGRARWLPDTA